jgi:hypothetical protein
MPENTIMEQQKSLSVKLFLCPLFSRCCKNIGDFFAELRNEMCPFVDCQRLSRFGVQNERFLWHVCCSQKAAFSSCNEGL